MDARQIFNLWSSVKKNKKQKTCCLPLLIKNLVGKNDRAEKADDGGDDDKDITESTRGGKVWSFEGQTQNLSGLIVLLIH